MNTRKYNTMQYNTYAVAAKSRLRFRTYSPRRLIETPLKWCVTMLYKEVTQYVSRFQVCFVLLQRMWSKGIGRRRLDAVRVRRQKTKQRNLSRHCCKTYHS